MAIITWCLWVEVYIFCLCLHISVVALFFVFILYGFTQHILKLSKQIAFGFALVLASLKLLEVKVVYIKILIYNI